MTLSQESRPRIVDDRVTYLTAQYEKQFRMKDVRPRTPRSLHSRLFGAELQNYIESSFKQRNIEVKTAAAEYKASPNKEHYQAIKSAEDRQERIFKAICDIRGKLPVFFGVPNKDNADDYKIFASPLPVYESNPDKLGYIAKMRMGNTEFDNYIKYMLLVGKRGVVPIDAKAYKRTPTKPEKGFQVVFYNTVLTESDGIVWFEHVDKNGRTVNHSTMLMIYPKESVVSPQEDYSI